LDATPSCEEELTEAQIEGPFYTPDAPERTVLVESGDPGVRLRVQGRVLDVACQAIGSALLDVWQADDEGAYDTAGFRFRGRLYSAGDGAYLFDTIIPGRYLNGAMYRPAHIHVKVSAPGYLLLTTQLYFEGDPFNDSDPFLHPSLVMPLEDEGGGGKRATFDFVLRPA
jgi:protocatechuate 3,4-dioxygenase beta subunit